MKASWQRGLLASGLTLIGVMIITFSVRAASLADHQELRAGLTLTSSQVHSTPLSETLASSLFLPIVVRPPGMLYGIITEYGLPAADVNISLVRCLTWSVSPGGQWYCGTSETYGATTDRRGWYAFVDMPTLEISPGEILAQTYQANWTNATSAPGRLARWSSRTIDSYTQGDDVNLGNFDIGGIALLTPTTGSDVHFPVTFQWIPRHNVPTDNYDVCVFGGKIIPKFDPGDYICLGPYAYTNQITMSDPFDGVDYGYGYNWYVSAPDDTGGVGYSPSVPFTFASP